ncbi:MAG: DUF2062 domain-containing protein [Symploca sp. SIO3C6]|uniref:DUF2062 domain-containing protein n=1 Tax=Symploca sp. SIO1C4 TaxID=2607765 RepID=A0A6B3N3D7_9CYAN|nr:DUF2062 domain-containing protein [Symploca sp. SIO3C6]NER27679.1 DUF2062 domain-containing protein [Symploca sp. SIO1C4]NET04393.1 DUF2062 domain-containing protein [Symploca sp. SIO2B6]
MSRNYPPTHGQRFPSPIQPHLSDNFPLRNPRNIWLRRLKYFYWRLVRQQGTPEKLARGLACGIFAGLFPIFGIQMIISILLAFIVRGNKFIAAAGTWISNPVTYVPIYAFNFHVGQWLLKEKVVMEVNLESWQELKDFGSAMLVTLFVGSLAVGSVGAIASYLLGLWVIRKYRDSSNNK